MTSFTQTLLLEVNFKQKQQLFINERRGLRIFMGILSHEKIKIKIDKHFMLACSRGAYQNVLLRKSGGGAYRGGGA